MSAIPDYPEAHGRSESPTLRLIGSPAGEREEGQHAAGERDQGCARDHRLACAGKHNEDQYEAKNEASDDRTENDQSDVPAGHFVLVRHDAGTCLLSSLAQTRGAPIALLAVLELRVIGLRLGQP